MNIISWGEKCSGVTTSWGGSHFLPILFTLPPFLGGSTQRGDLWAQSCPPGWKVGLRVPYQIGALEKKWATPGLVNAPLPHCLCPPQQPESWKLRGDPWLVMGKGSKNNKRSTASNTSWSMYKIWKHNLRKIFTPYGLPKLNTFLRSYYLHHSQHLNLPPFSWAHLGLYSCLSVVA